MSMELIKNIDR